MNAMDVALICKALGDANRLEIVKMLSDGEKCGCKNRGDLSEFHTLLFPFGSFLLAFYLFLWFTSESIGPFCKLKKKSCVKST